MRIAFILLCMLTSGVASAYDVTLTWDDVVGEDGYNLYRKLEKCDAPNPVAPWVLLGSVGQNVLTFVDPNVAPGTKVCYHATSFNEGGESAPSNTDGLVVKPNAPNLIVR